MTFRIDERPVAVVGAGPTGLTVASLLARYGIPTLLIERNRSTVEEPRAVSIDDEALRTMQAIGIVDQILPDLVLGYGSRYYSAAGKCFLRVEPTTREYGYPRRNAFHQPVLEAKLRDHLLTLNNVQVCFGSEVIGFRQENNCVSLHVRGANGVASTVSCAYLVGCDGAKSLIRQTLGIELTGSTFRERWLIVDLESTKDLSRHTKVFCDPARSCISLPGPVGTRRFEFMLQQEESEEEALATKNIVRLLGRYSNDDMCPIRRKAVYTFHARIAKRWRQGRVFLAGDAAHLSPPFAGQGMNSGIRDAHNLAWKLAAVLRGHLGPSLLDTYELERRDHASQMIRLATRMGHVMMPRNRLGALVMQTAFKSLSHFRGAHNYFAEMKYKPKPHFRNGFFVKPYPLMANKLLGRLFPQPTIQMPSRGSTLLDDVLGDGFTLLAPPGTAAQLFQQIPINLASSLPIARVAVTSPVDLSEVPDGVLKVVDAEGELSRQLDGMPPGLYLLRPDHYVAAFLSEGRIAAAFKQLQDLIASTKSTESFASPNYELEEQNR
jgi:3-(3-hydroxy-phenyl)propionate hydroxylase